MIDFDHASRSTDYKLINNNMCNSFDVTQKQYVQQIYSHGLFLYHWFFSVYLNIVKNQGRNCHTDFFKIGKPKKVEVTQMSPNE